MIAELHLKIYNFLIVIKYRFQLDVHIRDVQLINLNGDRELELLRSVWLI